MKKCDVNVKRECRKSMFYAIPMKLETYRIEIKFSKFFVKKKRSTLYISSSATLVKLVLWNREGKGVRFCRNLPLTLLECILIT